MSSSQEYTIFSCLTEEVVNTLITVVFSYPLKVVSRTNWNLIFGRALQTPSPQWCWSLDDMLQKQWKVTSWCWVVASSVFCLVVVLLLLIAWLRWEKQAELRRKCLGWGCLGEHKRASVSVQRNVYSSLSIISQKMEDIPLSRVWLD